tara:strand:+ start:717 stop:1460 length:744 start_codon:yes stop_codon:yes gene_type:complete
MALSSSGAISFSQIQTEFGGSNPISLSEYYSGSLPTNTGSTTSYTTTVGGYSATYTSGKNTYLRTWSGWCNENILPNLNQRDGTNTTQSIVINERSGVDIAGNAGTVPSSGTINLNHFRGTSAGTIDETYTLYGVVIKNDAGGTNYAYFYLDGHRGTEGASQNAFSTPFASISCATVSGTGSNAPATTLHCTTTATNNGFFQFRNATYHRNYTTIGNVTEFVCTASATAYSAAVSSGTGTWTQTINH